VDWLEAIGYQHEAVHTGALACLLKSSRGSEVARRLTGDARIIGVSNVHAEVVLSEGRRRPVDLAADLTLDGHGGGWLAVETKVDSAWRPEQLRESVPSECHGVLIAAGYTAFAVDDRDLAALDGYERAWRRVDPDALFRLVGHNASGDVELTAYAERLKQEAGDHARAVEAVRNGTPVTWGRLPGTLEHWAFFSEAVRDRGDLPRWERKSLISGPLLTRWIRPREDSGDYLEFMGEGPRRSLCVKTWADPSSGSLEENRRSLIESLDGLGGAVPRQPSGRAKTCTAVRFPLSGMRPAEAAALVEKLIGRLCG
jgi:hypothetical protein